MTVVRKNGGSSLGELKLLLMASERTTSILRAVSTLGVRDRRLRSGDWETLPPFVKASHSTRPDGSLLLLLLFTVLGHEVVMSEFGRGVSQQDFSPMGERRAPERSSLTPFRRTNTPVP